ncbi:uncharacterized protein [Littorina saxatilis]|uniref:uncharacterized protein n=1 Tax=Littorina saxatilis TaxID=31220 RepID=UPI0038B44A7B
MLEIEVVGERCRRKNEPRPSRGDGDDGNDVIPSRPPATPEDAIIRSVGKKRRPVSTNGSRAYLTSASSWRHKQFYRQGNAFSGPLGYERDAVSRGETGMRVKISYVDRKGRIRATPTTSHTDRPVSSPPASYREQESPIAQDYPELSEANDLCGWRSTSPNFSDRLYRPQRSPSAKDRAFSAVLSRSTKKLEIHGISSFRGPDSAKEEKEVPPKIGSPASMLSLRHSSGPTNRARSATRSGAVETNGSDRSHSGANIHTVSDTSKPGETYTTEMVTLGSDKENLAKLHEKSVPGGQWGIPMMSELVGTMATRPDSKGGCSPEPRHVTFSEDLTDRKQPTSFSSIASTSSHMHEVSENSYVHAPTAPEISNGHIFTPSMDFHSQVRTASACSNGHLPTASMDLHSQVRTASASSNGHILTAAINLNNQVITSSAIQNGHVQTPSPHSSVPTPSSSLSSSGPLRTPSSNDTRWFDLTDGPSRTSMNVNGRLPTVAAIPNGHIPSPSPHSSGPKRTSFLKSGGTLRTSSADSNSHRQAAAAISNGHIATHSPHATRPTPTSSLSSSGPLRTPSTSAKSTSVLTSKSHGGRFHQTRHRQQSSQRLPNVRPFSTTASAERRLNARIPACVKERLRSLWYSSSRRRANSATTERWKWAAGMGDGARDEKVVRDENAPPSESKMYRKFRLVGWLTLTLIRLKAAIVINSQDRTERSAAEIQWRTLFGEQGTEKLAFDKSRFSREKLLQENQRFPSDAAIMESYKTMVTWNAYKVKVLGDVIRSRDLRSAPLYRGPERETVVDPTGRLSPDRNQPPSRPVTARDRKIEDKKKKANVLPIQDEKDDDKTGKKAEDKDVVSDVQEQEVDNMSEGSSGGETREEKLADDNEERTVSVPPTATQEKPPAIFPVVEVDTTTYPPSPRIEPPLADTITAEYEVCPHIAPVYGIGPAPTAVIIHRQFTTPGVYRPYTTPETKLFTHKEKDKPAKSRAAQTTRFLLTTDVNNRSSTSK